MKYRVELKGSKDIQNFVLEPKHSINLGRVSEHKGIDNHLIDEDDSVSRLHAVITNTKKGLAIKDLSQNHTYVNGVEIDHQVKTKLEAGDSIRLGSSSKVIKIS